MEYRETETAPEKEKVDVVWGENMERPGYGTALRLGSEWFIYSLPNPHAEGITCAVPDGWLPEDRSEWTKAETRLLDILALNPDL